MSLFETKADLSPTEDKCAPKKFVERCIGSFGDYVLPLVMGFPVTIFTVGICKTENDNFFPIGITGHKTIPVHSAFDRKIYVQQFDVYCNKDQLFGRGPYFENMNEIKDIFCLDSHSVCRSFYVMQDLTDHKSLAEDIKLIVKYSFSGDDYQNFFDSKFSLVNAKTKVHVFSNIWEIKKPYKRLNSYPTFL